MELNSQKIFSVSPKPLVILLTAKHLTTFVVLDINRVDGEKYFVSDDPHNDLKSAGGVLAEAEVNLQNFATLCLTVTA